MNEYSWHDAEKDKPEDGRSVLVCFSGTVGLLGVTFTYYYAYGVGEYRSEDDRWNLQEFVGDVPPNIRIHGWKEIEPFDLEG